VRDPGDTPLPGVAAYLDTNNNGSRDGTEPARVSDENGMYLFDDLTPGTYNVRRIAPAEFLAGPSTPAAGVYAVAVAAGRRTRGLDFGNVRPVSVRVTDVFVNATSWSGTYRKFVTDRALGESAYGVNVGGGAVALDELPWLGLNQVSIRFNTQANVGPYHLAIRSAAGPAATYAITNYAYDPATRTATWTLAAPLGLDRVTLDLDGDPGGVTDQTGRSLLDGESTNDALPSGNGTVGGDFRFRLNVVPGDVDRNGRVDAFDTLGVKAKQGSSPTVNPTNYSAILDVDGSGRIDAFDTLGVKAKQGTSLSQVPNPPLVVAAPLFGERRLAGDAEADELAALLA
jgi:hypothetical protein